VSSEIEKKSLMKNLNIKEKSIFILPNVIIPKGKIHLSDVEVLSNSGSLRIVYFSRISKDKNILYTLDVLCRVERHVVYDIYGPIEDLYIWNEFLIKSDFSPTIDKLILSVLLEKLNVLLLDDKGELFKDDELDEEVDDELESLNSLSIKTYKSEDKEEDSNASEGSDEDDGDDVKVLLQLYNFPVMMILMDTNESTMDDLLEDYDEVGCEPGSKLWEEKWSAWLFQVISALGVIQTLFGFTHNDLHSNNIVWEYTDQLYLYYKTNDGVKFKVPTYGKIFKIIDFGRSIFSINKHLFVSDDFKEGNDAATQYNFPELNGENSEKIIYPNPSFDLARLSISIFECLFPECPNIRENDVILSQEEGRIVKETESDLFNILWSWLIDSNGENILWDSEGEERFPDFELYTHIADKCFNCIPKEQIYKKPFSKFIVNSIPKSEHTYSLFI
jgi:hypothetical protein